MAYETRHAAPNPIVPLPPSVLVDRTMEQDTLTPVCEALKEPWGPYETDRYIKFPKEVPMQVAYWIQEELHIAGWIASLPPSTVRSQAMVDSIIVRRP